MVAAFNLALLALQHNLAASPFSILVITTLLGATLVVVAMAYTKTRRLTQELKRANQAKLEFLTTMSHELRTPLNAIAGYTELLLLGLRGPVTAEQREDLSRIQRNQRQLLALVNDVLNFAKLDVGSVQYLISNVPVASTIETALQLVAPQIREKNIEYEAIGLTDSVCVRADDEKLHQIFVNLLLNAVKFTKVGGKITLCCSQDVTPHVVRIAITDTGIGIPHERLGDIFDPFVQVDTSLTRQHSGVGLGLSISRNLALGMNGDLVAESTVGEGSTFTVILPAVAPINPSTEVASPNTYRWQDHSTLPARVSPHALAP